MLVWCERESAHRGNRRTAASPLRNPYGQTAKLASRSPFLPSAPNLQICPLGVTLREAQIGYREHHAIWKKKISKEGEEETFSFHLSTLYAGALALKYRWGASFQKCRYAWGSSSGSAFTWTIGERFGGIQQKVPLYFAAQGDNLRPQFIQAQPTHRRSQSLLFST